MTAPRTPRTGLPIYWRSISVVNGDGSGPEVSYLCDEGHHQRCTGLVAPGGRAAYLCGCSACGCNDRARKAVLG